VGPPGQPCEHRAGRRLVRRLAEHLAVQGDDRVDAQDGLGRIARRRSGLAQGVLQRERGPDACEILVSRLRREGAERAIELAFDSRFRHVEGEWRRYLREEVPRAGSLATFDEEPFA